MNERLLRLILIGAIISIPILGVGMYGVVVLLQREEKVADTNYEEIDWRLLEDFNLRTAQVSDRLGSLNGRKIKIPGFIVPLEDNLQEYNEFLLVPSPQACIHVPPPPANQMLLVTMTQGEAPRRTSFPIWIKGRLHITKVNSPYGEVAFKLYAEATEEYKIEY